MWVVTGATGHVGNTLVRRLLELGQKVRAVVHPSEDVLPLKGLDVEIVRGDVRDLEFLEKAFKGAEVVFHLAGIISISGSKKARKLMEEVNVNGTKNVVEAVRRAGVKRLVYTSSVHAFKEPPAGVPLDETFPFDPQSVIGDYAKTKAKASLIVLEAARGALDAVIVAPSGVIGPNDWRLSATGNMIVAFLKGQIWAYMDGAYNFVDVRDVAEGLVLVAQKGKKGEVYILAGGVITVKRMMEIIAEAAGEKPPRVKVPFWLAKVAAFFEPLRAFFLRVKPIFTSYSLYVLKSNPLINSAKAERELDWHPRPLEESLKDTVKWYIAHGYV